MVHTLSKDRLGETRSRAAPSEPTAAVAAAVVRPAAPSPTASSIEIRGLDKAFGAAPVLRGIDLSVTPGRIVALLGPSGCGKTTLLRTIAGLERPDAGTVTLAGRAVAGNGTFVAPERRRVGLVFQDWALFPHLSVGRNVGYGLPRRQRTAERIEATLAMVGLEGLADRAPGTLSGGQQQRVALARAIAPQPSLLLLDEPFSNLDTALRIQVRTEIHQLLVDLGITTVFVTHDQEEAFVLGDEVAVMEEGRIVQQATPAELYDAPATPWVASFIGDANLIDAEARDGRVTTAVGTVPLLDNLDGPVQVVLRPEEVRLSVGEGATVELVEYYGHDTVYLARPDDDGDRIRARVGSAPRFRRGDRVELSYTGNPAVAYPR